MHYLFDKKNFIKENIQVMLLCFNRNLCNIFELTYLYFGICKLHLNRLKIFPRRYVMAYTFTSMGLNQLLSLFLFHNLYDKSPSTLSYLISTIFLIPSIQSIRDIQYNHYLLREKVHRIFHSVEFILSYSIKSKFFKSLKIYGVM